MDRLSNQAIIHHFQNLTKKPTQTRFEIEVGWQYSKSTETRVVAVGMSPCIGFHHYHRPLFFSAFYYCHPYFLLFLYNVLNTKLCLLLFSSIHLYNWKVICQV